MVVIVDLNEGRQVLLNLYNIVCKLSSYFYGWFLSGPTIKTVSAGNNTRF